MRIGIDLDETISDSIVGIMNLHNKQYGTSLRREDFDSYVFTDILGVSKEEARKRVDEFFSVRHVKAIPPIEGSLEAINLLKSKGHELYIITGRGRAREDVLHTEAWLEEHFPQIFAGVHYANVLGPDGTLKTRTKSEIAKSLRVELMIDDVLDFARDCGEAGIKTFLFDRPWNQSELPPNVARVFSWEEIAEKIG
jgi:uncharacterized protein